MALGFGGSVASLKATLTLDDDGFIRGMADASTKLDAYNAKLKEQGVGSRLATMATRDYARQLYDEAKTVDQANAAHGRLYQTLMMGQRHWKALSVGAAGAGVGILALTGNLGGLLGVLGQLGTVVLPVFTAALTAVLTPFTSLAAIIVAATGPLTVLTSVLGGVGLGAVLGFTSALKSSGPEFAAFRKGIEGLKDGFGTLTHTLAEAFMPWFMSMLPVAKNILGVFQHLATVAGKGGLEAVFKALAQGDLEKLNRDMLRIIRPIGNLISKTIAFAFGTGGREGQSMIVADFNRFTGWADKAFAPIIRWFDKQHFTRTGARWAAELVASAGPVIANGLWNAITSVFDKTSAWGKLGLLAGAAFAANFFSGGLLSKGLLAGGKGLVGLLGGGAAGAAGAGVGAGVEGAAGGAAAAGAGIISAGTVAAIAAVAVPAALVYLSSRQSASSQNKYGITPGVHPRGPGSPGFLPDSVRLAADKYAKSLAKVNAEEKLLNQFISDGGKSVLGWKNAVQKATNQAQTAQAAIHGLAAKGIISADQAATQSKANLQNFINQEDAIARKATAASQNTAKFGASTRAQYAHVAALARTSAQLAAAIDSIPSTKYVSLVLSITENLKTQGLAPGQGGAGGSAHGNHAAGAVITGGTPNRDSVPAMLMPGEVVLSKKAIAQHFGGNPYAAHVLNFAGGGLVPPHRHKKETRNAYRGRVSSWLSQTVASKQGVLDFDIAIADRIAQRDDTDQNYAGEIHQLMREQAFRHKEITLFDRAARVARRFGLRGSERGYRQDAAFLLQDILDTQETIEGLKGQTSTAGGAGGGASLASQIAAFLAEQQAFISQFGSNVNITGAGNANVVTSGTPAASSGKGGSAGGRLPNRTIGGGVIIHNHFTQTPPDSFVHIRKARLQAAAVFQ